MTALALKQKPASYNVAFLSANVIGAKYHGSKIRKYNSELHSLMKVYGILQPKFEGFYPKRWIDPVEVAKTHPACYVAKNGDLVFRKPTRMEYYRYLYQKKLPGKAGFHTWRWRIYLRPPEAPEKVREWAKAKLKREMQRMKNLAPRPLPRPVPVPIGIYSAKARHQKTGYSTKKNARRPRRA